MSASEHLHPELFHGTTNPNWRDNPDWIHAGSTRQAQQRLEIGLLDRTAPATIHKIELHPDSTIYPKVIPAREDPEDGFWADLGHRLDENSIDLELIKIFLIKIMANF